MASQVAHRPAILTMLVSSTARSGRGGAAQSMPVDAWRCTLSTINDHNTIGTPQATTAATPALGPFIP